MKWEDFQSSENVEDRRGQPQVASRRVGAGGLGLGTVIILGLIGYFTGINPAVLIGGAEMLNSLPKVLELTLPVVKIVSAGFWPVRALLLW